MTDLEQKQEDLARQRETEIQMLIDDSIIRDEEFEAAFERISARAQGGTVTFRRYIGTEKELEWGSYLENDLVKFEIKDQGKVVAQGDYQQFRQQVEQLVLTF